MDGDATPVATGPSAGIFSIAFRDALHGIVVGGDYKKETDAIANVATTDDGGAAWCAPRPSAYPLSGASLRWAAWMRGAGTGRMAGGRSLGLRTSPSTTAARAPPGGGEGYDAAERQPRREGRLRGRRARPDCPCDRAIAWDVQRARWLTPSFMHRFSSD